MRGLRRVVGRYLHITDTLATAAAGGLVLHADRVGGVVADDVVPARRTTTSR